MLADLDLVQALRRVLAELPEEKRLLARLLHGHGLMGCPGVVAKDPLGRFVAARLTILLGHEVAVLPSDVDISVIRDGALVHVDELPTPLSHFVVAFDRGEFPCLLEGWGGCPSPSADCAGIAS